MKKSEMTAKIQALGQMATPEEMRAELANLQRELEADYDSHEAVVAERDQALADQEELRKANMKLFKQVGVKEEPGKEPGKAEPSTEDLKYENLFDEKGGLK